MKLHLIAAAALAAAATLPAHALLVTDASAIAGPTTAVDFEAFDGLLTSGPVAVAPGVVFSGDSAAEKPFDGCHGLGVPFWAAEVSRTHSEQGLQVSRDSIY